jgi:hypothetical protein
MVIGSIAALFLRPGIALSVDFRTTAVQKLSRNMAYPHAMKPIRSSNDQHGMEVHKKAILIAALSPSGKLIMESFIGTKVGMIAV